MRTLIVSDLHLGSASRGDLLRTPPMRAPLLEIAREVDQVVLLGDALELRHGPAREALSRARPFLEDLGSTLAGREVVICPGNHDYAVLAPWLARRADAEAAVPLGVEQRLPAADATPILAELARVLEPASLTVAYPGLWLRSDVYATHGHYLDCHVTIPTLERLGIGAMNRILGRPSGSLQAVDDYEAVSAPLYAWIDAVARQGPTNPALNGSVTVKAWHALGGGDSTHSGPASGWAPAALVRKSLASASPALRRGVLKRAFPLVVGAFNRAGMGPLRAEISASELRRAGLLAIGEVAARLGLGEAWVIFGHTHRAGPLADDDPAEWRGRAGARLMNTGCWTYERAFLTPASAERNHYWPGSCVLVEDTGAPQLLRLLVDRSREELRACREG